MKKIILKIKIKRRTDCEKIIMLIFLVISLEGIFSVFIPQAHVLYYLVDILNIILVLECMGSRRIDKLFNKITKLFMLCFVLFLMFSFIGTAVNFSNIILHIWGYRRILSTLFFFIACICFQRTQDLDFINKLFWLNLSISIIEILLGYRQDCVGGLYGVSQGQVNGPLNILLIIFTTKVIIEYINKETSIKKLLLYIFTSLFIAAYAELKIYFVELVLIVALCSLVTKFSLKKLLLFILGGIAAIVGVTMLSSVFSDFSMDILSIKYIWNYITNPGGYVGQFDYNAGDVNRLSFWNKCIIYLNGTLERLFGLGVGNCDSINIINVQSEFYIQHNSLHYYMFPLPMILLEQGILGFVLYIFMFVAIFVAINRREKTGTHLSTSVFQIAKVLNLMAFVITIYDTSILGKGGFLFYYILSLPLVGVINEKKVRA